MRRKIPATFLVGLSCCVLLIGIGIALVWGPASPHPTRPDTGYPPFPPAAPEATSARQDIEAIHTELARLKRSTSTWEQHAATMQRELTALRSQLMQVDQGQTALAQALDQLRKHVLAARPEPPSMSERDTAAVSHAPREEMAHTDARQLETLEAELNGEKPDPAWARNAEQALHALWQGQENSGLSLVHVECRTSLCRLELDLDGTSSAEESLRALMYLIPWSGQSAMQIIEGEAPQVVMYLARRDTNFPRNETRVVHSM